MVNIKTDRQLENSYSVTIIQLVDFLPQIRSQSIYFCFFFCKKLDFSFNIDYAHIFVTAFILL